VTEARAHGIYSHRDVVGAAQHLDRYDAVMGESPDTVVVDEPFYAFYLKETGTKHPGAEEVIAQGETDWRKVVEQCRRNANLVEDSPWRTRTIFYQKQMTHHLLPEISRDWLRDVTNCFLIRDPAEVIASYIKKNPELQLNDLGFVQQAEIFDFVRHQTGSIPPVIDADDVLRDPGTDAAVVVRRHRRRIFRRDVVVATRPARHGWNLGKILVCGSRTFDRLSTLSGPQN
jgi:hypothetical protein